MAKVEISSNADEVFADLRARLAEYNKQNALTVFKALTLLEAEILSNIRSKSGLKVRSGSLLNSVGGTKKVEILGDGSIAGQIGTEGVPYAAIHEFGGVTSPHHIEPRNAKALAFMNGGNKVFSKGVNHPGSKIPERPYLRPALAAKQDEIVQYFGIMIQAAFEKK